MNRKSTFIVFLLSLMVSYGASAACTTLATNAQGQVTKEDCGPSVGVKEYRYDGNTRYTTTTKTESGNTVIREETHISAKNNGSYGVATAYKETTYDAQNRPINVENRYYEVTQSANGTKSSHGTNGVIVKNKYCR